MGHLFRHRSWCSGARSRSGWRRAAQATQRWHCGRRKVQQLMYSRKVHGNAKRACEAVVDSHRAGPCYSPAFHPSAERHGITPHRLIYSSHHVRADSEERGSNREQLRVVPEDVQRLPQTPPSRAWEPIRVGFHPLSQRSCCLLACSRWSAGNTSRFAGMAACSGPAAASAAAQPPAVRLDLLQ